MGKPYSSGLSTAVTPTIGQQVSQSRGAKQSASRCHSQPVKLVGSNGRLMDDQYFVRGIKTVSGISGRCRSMVKLHGRLQISTPALSSPPTYRQTTASSCHVD